MSNREASMQALIQLYEQRREPEMRRARAWFFSEFAPAAATDIAQLYARGERDSAYFRMTVSYWDMAASFVTNGALDAKMFQDASSEYLYVYAKIAPFLAELRELFHEPDYFAHLEQVVKQTPNYEAKLETRRRLSARWTLPAPDAGERVNKSIT